MQHEIDCSRCPFVTCNNHPQFYLALQCAMRKNKDQAGSAARAA